VSTHATAAIQRVMVFLLIETQLTTNRPRPGEYCRRATPALLLHEQVVKMAR
jgi:hypothetical protein